MRPYLRYLLSTLSTLTPVSASLAQVPATGSWAGPYFGLSLGASRHRGEFDGIDAIGGTARGENRVTGATYGAQFGYDWRSQNLVYGIEADLSHMGKQGSSRTSNSYSNPQPFNSELSHLITVRGRIGTLVSPSTLLYGNAGYAAGRTQHETPDLGGFRSRENKSGWTLGAGVEHVFAPRWTFKAELMYVDLGTSTVRGALGSGYIGKFKDTAVVGRVGANFRF